MFVPVPIVIVVSLIFFAMIAWIARSSRRRDPLLGGSSPTGRPAAVSGSNDKPVTSLATLPPDVDLQVRALIKAGRTIDAIKLVRNTTHLGLKESKELVEGRCQL
jgi:hypothetical protein